MNPQGNEWNPLYEKNHEDHIAGKGNTSMTYDNVVHKFISVPQAMKNSGCKGTSGEGMEEARNNPSMATGESQ